MAAVFLGLASSLLFANFASAQNCPANTTVSGTTVTFVGELTDMGGDQTAAVWFQYGQTTAYGQETIKKTLTSAGIYCITTSGLLPATTYHYRAVAQNSAGTSYGENKTFTTTAQLVVPTADIKANNSNGPITIAYDTSATLTWTSSNADSCYASNAWSGTKTTSGSQSTGNLTSSRTYTLTCTGPGGSAFDSVTVNVASQPPADAEFSVTKSARNLSDGTAFFRSLQAKPGDNLVFGIVIRAGDDPIYDVVVKDILPARITYQGDLKVDNVLTTGNIFTGLNIGNIAAGQKKTITFRANLADPESFAFGQTRLANAISVTSGEKTYSDAAEIIVSKTAVAGVATAVPTGLTNSLLFDSFILPLLMTLSLVWLFKARIIRFEEWLDSRKNQYHHYKSRKMLQFKVVKIKTKDFFSKRYKF